MANITKFNTRVQLKFDTWANWTSAAGAAFIPLKGEICICEVPADAAATGEVLSEKAYLIRIGDGETAFNSLPWLSAPAADVHAWAKKSYDDIIAELKNTFVATDGEDYSQLNRYVTDLRSYFDDNGKAKQAIRDGDGNIIAGTYATKDELDAIGDLANVMNFKGLVTTNPATITTGYNDGDVVLYNNKEYVFSNGAFHEFGDTSAVSQAVTNLSSIVSNLKFFSTVKAGATALTADSNSGEVLNVEGGTAITVTGTDTNDIETMTIAHSDISCTKGTTSTLTPSHKGTFNIIESVTVNDQGHVTAYQPRTIQLPSIDDINSGIASIYSYSHVAADNTDNNDANTLCSAIKKNEKITIAGGTKLTSIASNSSAGDSDKITIDHDTTTRTDTTSTASPAHSGTFTVVDSITSDSTGHITAANVKTVTLPAQYDDSNVQSRLTTLEEKVWATTPIATVANGATTAQLGELAKSPLTIGKSSIEYIIFDCGSATINV